MFHSSKSSPTIKSGKAQLDEDEYILNPSTHFEKLRELRDFVEQLSELKNCNGIIKLDSTVLRDEVERTGFSSTSLKERLLAYLPLDTNNSLSPKGVNLGGMAIRSSLMLLTLAAPFTFGLSLGASVGLLAGNANIWNGAAERVRNIISHVAKTYLICQNVVSVFSFLNRARFCGSFFSIIINSSSSDSSNTPIAKVKKVEFQDIRSFADELRELLSMIPEKPEAANGVAVSQFLRRLKSIYLDVEDKLSLQLGSSAVPDHKITERLRLIAVILDVGLVSYVGSHASNMPIASDTPDFTQEKISIGRGSPNFKPLYELSRGPLTCLSSFLDSGVWMFSEVIYSEMQPTERNEPSEAVGYSLLTKIDTFADLWGPAWIVEPPQIEKMKKNQVLQLQLSKGCIRRVATNETDSERPFFKCHWYADQEIPLGKGGMVYHDEDLIDGAAWLLIGEPGLQILEKNEVCSYSLEEFETMHGMDMTELCTREARWQLESRTISIQGGYNFAITLQGTQKLIPEVSLKQNTLAKLRNEPLWMRPQLIHQQTGLEVSICTGNARRLTLEKMLGMPHVQRALEEYTPGWKTEDYGVDFLQGLADPSTHGKWYNDPPKRSKVAALIVIFLTTLQNTGVTGNQLCTAFLTGGRERAIKIEVTGNEWLKVLRDSTESAVYAILSPICLSKNLQPGIMNHFIAADLSKPAFTVLETTLEVRSESVLDERLRLSTGTEVIDLKIDSRQDDLLVLTMLESAVLQLGRRIRSLHSRPPKFTAREVLYEDNRGGSRFKVLLKSKSLPRRGHLNRGTALQSVQSEQTVRLRTHHDPEYQRTAVSSTVV